MQTIGKPLLLALLAFILAGCGFHLRGHEPLPPQLKVIYLESSSPYDDFTKQLKLFLNSVHVTLTPTPQEAPITLKIINQNTSQQLTSSGSNGQTNTYTLTYTVVYQLLDKAGQPIQGQQSVSTSRNYSVTSNQVLGDTNVQNSMLVQMQRDAIYQLLNRLRTPQTLRDLTAKLGPTSAVQSA